MYIGQSLHTGDYEQLAVVLLTVGLGASLIKVGPRLLSILPRIREPRVSDPREDLLWQILFPVVGLVGLAMLQQGVDRELNARMIAQLVKLLPILSVLVSLPSLGWLLRPFRLEQVFSKHLPRRVRFAIAFLAVTAVLPHGGLAIPIWIYVRHQLWPSDSG
jgi:hypothetical protein